MFNLEDAKKLYIEDLRSSRKSENTIRNYSGVLNRLIRYCKSNDINLSFPDTETFQQTIYSYKVSIDCYSKGSVKGGITVKYEDSSINTYRCCMRSFIAFLHKWHYIKENFSDDIDSVKMDTGKRKEVLDYDDLSTIKEMLDKDVAEAENEKVFIRARNRFAFWMLLTTGIREGEAVNLKWTNIDTAKRNRIYIDKGKGNKSRYIPIMPQFKGVIYDYQTIIKQLQERGYNIESEYVLTSYRKHKGPMTRTNLYHIIVDIINRSGIEKNISPHNLRHTFSSIAIDKKVKLPVLSNWLGHANPKVTAQVYIHELTEEENTEEMTKLEGVIPL